MKRALTAAVTGKIDVRQEGDRCSRTFTDNHGQIRNYMDGNVQAEMTGAGMVEKEPLIPKHGGYRKLKSFQVAQLVYDVTVRFCELYVDQFSRTRDQMVQAARSGVQNIAEGSQASATSRKTELKLTNVARASLEELRLDYEDFLRQRGLRCFHLIIRPWYVSSAGAASPCMQCRHGWRRKGSTRTIKDKHRPAQTKMGPGGP